MDDDGSAIAFWRDKANSAEAKLGTVQDNIDRMKADAQEILALFAAKKKADGSFQIDFDKLVDRLGLEQAFELRQVIDAKYRISGAPGEKPRIKAVG